MALNNDPRAQALLQLFEGELQQDGAAELCRAFRSWLASATPGGRGLDGELLRARPISLAACLGLQESPERARIALRDAYLRQAASLLPRCNGRAAGLFHEAQRFAGWQWMSWIDRAAPPEYATELQRALFYAMRAGGGRLPSTIRQFANILRE